MTGTSLLEAARELALLTGAVALRRYREHLGGHTLAVETKSDGSPVSNADREAEQAARDWLATRFPQDGILGEELGASRPDATRVWCIDPIDGTKSFLGGAPLWGTLVAVVEGRDVLAGAAAFPATEGWIAAAPGEGCICEAGTARVSTLARLDAATVLTTDERFPDALHCVDPWRSVAAEARIARTWGDAYGYYLVAKGRAELMTDGRLAAWDAACWKPIVEEAGGVFTDWRGEPTGLGEGAIATNATLAVVIRERLGVPMHASPGARWSISPSSTPIELDLDSLDFAKADGLVTVVVQHATTDAVLMVAYADREALEHTLRSGSMHFYSRSRKRLWKKGESSGNVLSVASLEADCDRDAVLARCLPAGPTCHTGAVSCFGTGMPSDAIRRLEATVAARADALAGGAESDATSYTHKLLQNRNLRLKKLGEEMAELVVALADDDRPRAAEEGADVLYHLVVALRAGGIGLDAVREVLAARAGPKPPPGV